MFKFLKRLLQNMPQLLQKMRRTLTKVRQAAAVAASALWRRKHSLLWDVCGLAGLGTLAWGLWLAWPPAAPICVGLAFMVLAIMGAKRCS